MDKMWVKLGQIFSDDDIPGHPQLMAYAANPLAVHLEGDVYRIFYSSRDIRNRSSVGAVDVDIIQKKIVHKETKPLFCHGAAGSFYADGVSIGNCYEVNGVRYILFMGWQTPPDAHWRGDIGRLIVDANYNLQIDSAEPIMGVDSVDTISLSYPWVMKNPAGGFDMWYGSTRTWCAENNEMVHVINYAFSRDGFTWDRRGLAVPFELGVAQAFSRPAVVRHGDSLEMWFSYRSGDGQKYRIGYATSAGNPQGFQLQLPSKGIDVSAHGWDSEMIEYPFVFEHKGDMYMLYNGNGNGRTGFGLAIRER